MQQEEIQPPLQQHSVRFNVAPMIDYTDRHCRFFHRQLSAYARLYTPMIVDEAIIRANPSRLLEFDAAEHPVALQLGGADPQKLAQAARVGASFGYDEINLNVGCPSDRVQSGTFGACLMRVPHIVADAVAAMRAAVSVPVTIKCRIGVDDQDPEDSLFRLVQSCRAAGAQTFIVHARKAWLKGLSPKENRTIPPLDYAVVASVKEAYPDLTIVLNGGITQIDQAKAHVAHFDGVMLGRAAYENPFLLARVDTEFFEDTHPTVTREAIIDKMAAYIDRQIAQANPVRPYRIIRHMLGLFHGQPGARAWRRTLTNLAQAHDVTGDSLLRALHQVQQHKS